MFFNFSIISGAESHRGDMEDKDYDIELRIGGGPSPSGAWTLQRNGVARNMTVSDIDKALKVCNQQLRSNLRMDDMLDMLQIYAENYGSIQAAAAVGSVQLIYDGMYRAGWSEKRVVEYSIKVLKDARKRAQRDGRAGLKFRVYKRPANGEVMIAWGF